MELHTTVAGGLPCIVRLVRYAPALPAYYSHWHGWQPPEPAELEYLFLDLRGKPAPWIERRASDDDIARIEAELIAEIEDADHYA